MNVGRPREFDKEQALDAAMHLFWRQGYEATSMQDLLDAMNLSKSSLYQTYGSKHDLFQQCIAYYRQMMADASMQALQEAANGKKFIEGFFQSVLDTACNSQTRIGCLVMNTATELAPHDQDIGKMIKQSTEKFTSIFKLAIEQAQTEGDISRDRDAASLAYFLMSSLSGFNAMAKAGASQKVLTGIIQEILQSLR